MCLNKLQLQSAIHFGKIMNFDSQTPIDTLIGRLLAFVIMFEKKIEFLKCKLAGNEEFHTRLAFQKLDESKKNQITSANVGNALRNFGYVQSESACECFIRKYSKNGGLSYEEFLKLVTPKGNKILSQRMMIRTFRRGAVLEDYLLQTLIQLLLLFVKMSSISEQIRRLITQNEDLSYIEVIEFFHKRISSPNDLLLFLSRCTEEEEQYDIQAEDAVYLSYHIQSGNDLTDFTDMDIKELICPLDMNYQKHITSKGSFYKTKVLQEQPQTTKTTNFLGKTYQKIYSATPKSSIPSKESQKTSSVRNNQPSGTYYTKRYEIGQEKGSADHSYGGLFIDNFDRSDLQPGGLELDRFLLNKMRDPKNPVQIFEDDLNNNSSSVSRQSQGSAFDRN